MSRGLGDVYKRQTGFFVVIAIAAGISALLLLPFLNAQAPRTASEA